MQKFDVYSALLAETDNKLKENLFLGGCRSLIRMSRPKFRPKHLVYLLTPQMRVTGAIRLGSPETTYYRTESY